MSVRAFTDGDFNNAVSSALATPKTVVVTHASGKFSMDGMPQKTLSFALGGGYVFDLNDASNIGLLSILGLLSRIPEP